jgi:hypothetical protein
MAHQVTLQFEGLSQPCVFENAPEFCAALGQVFDGWRMGEVDGGAQRPVLTVRHSDNGYQIEGEWVRRPILFADRVDALCAFIAELVRAWVQPNPNLLCLHGAAVELGERLVVFPSTYRAGKSVLTACLAAAGAVVHTDDVLPIDPALGVTHAPGIAPRLRLPVPDVLDEQIRQFIDAHTVLRGKRYAYVDPGPGVLASHGKRARIGALVLLDRSDESESQLLPVGRNEILRHVIWQNFARAAPAPEILDALHAIVAGAQCYRLRYSRADQAAALLMDAASSWSPMADTAPSGVVKSRARCERAAMPRAGDGRTGCYRRAAGIHERRVDGECFLADAEGARIHHLNPIGSAIWQLLAEPASIEDLVTTLGEAFPELEAKQLQADVSAFVSCIADRGLLHGDGDGDIQSS